MFIQFKQLNTLLLRATICPKTGRRQLKIVLEHNPVARFTCPQPF